MTPARWVHDELDRRRRSLEYERWQHSLRPRSSQTGKEATNNMSTGKENEAKDSKQEPPMESLSVDDQIARLESREKEIAQQKAQLMKHKQLQDKKRQLELLRTETEGLELELRGIKRSNYDGDEAVVGGAAPKRFRPQSSHERA